MNLYKILLTHAAPKDNETAIKEYVVMENDLAVFEYLKNDSGYCYWKDYETDGDNETLDFILTNQGDVSLDSKWTDLYYGSTMYSWELVKNDILLEHAETLYSLGIIHSY